MVVLLALTACAPPHPTRSVPVPEACDALVRTAAERGVVTLSAEDREQLAFCQEQMALRTAEEQAAAALDQGQAARLGYTVTLLVSVVSLALSAISLAQ